ncbi:putative progesterone binding protein [Viridothelium virens]|uniref:Putative progesterone binding protein n=1 Tax=Viridothelium virens TaxID=1048519 RepID=A0A6A6H928_VIRVR|nr:putative progesterone binding protein [Viridothelium virens]
MSEREHVAEPKNFEPKVPVKLDPPKSDPISLEYLAKCDGTHEGYPTCVAIKGKVFDVTNNKAYGTEGQYHGKILKNFRALNRQNLSSAVFAGKDASRALAQSSLKPEDVRPEWLDLPDKEKTVLEEWDTFFSKRYNIIGEVQGSANL